MNNPSQNVVDDREVQTFLEGLDERQVGELIDSPFGLAVMQAAFRSPGVTAKIDASLDREFADKSPEERKRIEDLAARIAAKVLGSH